MLDTKITDQTDRRQYNRSGRHSARRILWDESTLKPVRLCGLHARNGETGLVAIKATGAGSERRAGLSGLMTCGSTWACPVCSHKISATRAVEVEQAITRWLATHPDFRVALLTLTMRHKKGQPLKALWDAVSYGWSKVTSGRGWENDQNLYGTYMPREIRSGARRGEMVSSLRIPFVRVVEATHGANGWHVHIHCVLFLGVSLTGEAQTDVDTQSLGFSMFKRWKSALVRKGFEAPSRTRGVDVKLLTGDAASALGDYFTKAVYAPAIAAGMETTMGQHKQSKQGNRTPFGILADVAANGDADDLDLWHEWERGSKGRRQLTWAQGLREFLALGDEATDEEIAEDDSLDGEVLVELTRDQWVAVRRSSSRLLDAAEADETGLALYALLSDLLPLWTRDQTSVRIT
jgi:hypothetical protein